MASFLGYFHSNDVNNANTIPDLSKGHELVSGDTLTLVGSIDEEQSTDDNVSVRFRLARNYIYGVSSWLINGDLYFMESVNPLLLPQAQRATNIFETYGLGVLPSFYSYISSNAIPDFATSSTGVALINVNDLESVKNTYTGIEISGGLPRTGLLPVFIRTNLLLVGTGTAVFTSENTLSVAWYKIDTSKDDEQNIITGEGYIFSSGYLEMSGDSRSFAIRAYINDERYETLTGNYNGRTTTYSLPSLEPGEVVNLIEVSTATGDIKALLYSPQHSIDTLLEGAPKIEEFIFTEVDEEPVLSLVPFTGDGLRDISIPHATEYNFGFMTPNQVSVLNQSKSMLDSLWNSGGSWIGENFRTEEDLYAKYPQSGFANAAMQIGDFTYVTEYPVGDDETKEAVFTIVATGLEDEPYKFAFNRFSGNAIPTATLEELGMVKGSIVDGDVFVNQNGTMSLNGYDTILARLTAIEDVLNLSSGLININNGVLNNRANIVEALKDLNKAVSGILPISVNIKEG